MEFTIKLQAEQVNVVLAGLDELQHKVSRRTLDTILQQVQAQEAAAQAPQAPEASTDAGLTD
jgi:hypothetical protein